MVSRAGSGDACGLRHEAEAALTRLVRLNPPGRVSVAGAYALGYAVLGMAQVEGDGPDWFDELDPLDAVFLGTVYPQRFRDRYEFANARTAWLRLLRGTTQWKGIQRFVTEAVAASEQHGMPVDEGELMLLLAGRVEAAGLDQREIPRALLPATVLADSRVATGPRPDFVLPEPPRNADMRVARMWAATEVDMPHDGSAADALREGLHLLGNAGVDVRGEPTALLPALYAALMAGDDQDVQEEVADRAMAWALGLPEDSPLVPVVDALIVGPWRGLGVDELLRCLYGFPVYTEQVRLQDRAWHSSPGRALVEIAFELGHPQVTTRSGKTIRLDTASVSLLRVQVERFAETFGRPPGPDNPLLFDPDADEPQPMRPPDLERHTMQMLGAADISPAWIYAYQHTDGLLPRPDGSFASEQDRSDWEEEIAHYLRLHPDTVIDHDAQTHNLQTALGILTLDIAAGNPAYGACLTQRLQGPDIDDDAEASTLRAYLRGDADALIVKLRDDHAVATAAVEYARAWAGAALAARVARTAAGTSPISSTADPAVLLAAAVAARTNR